MDIPGAAFATAIKLAPIALFIAGVVGLNLAVQAHLGEMSRT